MRAIFLRDLARAARCRFASQLLQTGWPGVQEWKRKYPLVLPEHRDIPDKVSMYHFSDVLSGLLSSGDLIVSGSSGTAVELFLLAFRVKEGQRVFHTRGLGSMGFAIPRPSAHVSRRGVRIRSAWMETAASR